MADDNFKDTQSSNPLSELDEENQPQYLVSIWDHENPRSLVNIVPDKVGQAMREAVAKTPDYFSLDEDKLYKLLRRENASPGPTDNRIRLKFWMEYDYAQSQGKRVMDITRIIAGVCSWEYFYAHYLKSPSRVAWMTCMPTGYLIKAEEALEFGLEQMRDLLGQPHEVNGRVDTKLGELKVKIYNMLDQRLRGAVVQKTMSLNVNTTSPQTAQALARTMSQPTMEQLNNRLKILRMKEKKHMNGGVSGAKEDFIEVQASDDAGPEQEG